MTQKKLLIIITIACLIVPALIITKKKQCTTQATPASSSPQKAALPAQAPAKPEPLIKTDAPNARDEKPATTRTVKIKSGINYDMLGYKHWGIWYHPSTFVLSINGTPFEYEQEHSVAVENNTLLITYHYEFLGGVRKGGRTLKFEIPASTQNLTMSFDWKDPQHVLFNSTATWLGEVESESKHKHKNKRKIA